MQPDHVAAAFDLSAPTFRHRQYAEYKAGRRHMPEEFAQQLPICKRAAPPDGADGGRKGKGYEADDIPRHPLSAAAAGTGRGLLYATGDRDSLQLVGEHVNTVLLASNQNGAARDNGIRSGGGAGQNMGLSRAADRSQGADGAPATIFPVCRGVGENRALDLMQRFHSLDEIYQNLDTLDIRDSLRQKLVNGRESALLSRELGTICKTAPVDTGMQAYAMMRAADIRPGWRSCSPRLEFFKQLEKLGLDNQTPTPSLEANLPVQVNVVGEEAINGLLDSAKAAGELTLLPVCRNGAFIAFCVAADGVTASVLAGAPAFDRLLEMIEDRAVKKYTHDAKALYGGMLRLPARRMWLSIPTSRRVPAQSAVLRLCAFPSVSGIWVVLPGCPARRKAERRYRMDRRSCRFDTLGQKHRPPNRPYRPKNCA